MTLKLDTLIVLLREHTIPILIGLCLAILIVSPHIRSWIVIGPENFEGVHPVFNDDEIYYQARIKEVSEGNFGLGNPYLKEHQNDPFLVPPISEWLIAAIVAVTGSSVPLVVSVTEPFIVFIDFLLVYALFFLITGKKQWLSLFYTVSFFFFLFTSYGRPISPQLNSIPFLIGLLVITKIYFGEYILNKKLHITAGLLVGLSCFLYPYFFTALFVWYFLSIAARVVQEKSMRFFANNTLWFLLAFLPCVSLYVFFQYKATLEGFYGEAVVRFGLMHTHIPGAFINIAFGMLAGFVLLLSIKILSRRDFLYGAIFVVSIFGLNWQNIITGKSLQFSSHYILPTTLSVLIILAVIHTGLFTTANKKISKYYKGAIIFGMLFLYVMVAYNQRYEYLNFFQTKFPQETLIQTQEKMDIFEWFNKETPTDSVVYSLGSDYDFLLPVYTNNKVYYNFYSSIFIVSNKETEERWLIQHLFDLEMSPEIIRNAQRDFWMNRFIDTYQSGESRKKIVSFVTGTPYVKGVMVPEELINELYSRWESLKQKPLEEALSSYEIDYILLSTEYRFYDEAKLHLDDMTMVEFKTSIDGNVIYAVKNTY